MSENKKIALPKVEEWPIGNLIPYEFNAKKHEKNQVVKIAAAIQRSGRFDQPIVVDRDGVIIKGHGRRLAAIELGMRTVPVVVYRHLTSQMDETKAMRLSDNRVAISDIDSDMLRIDIESMGDSSILIEAFDEKELDFLKKDPFEINADAFVEDMGKVLSDQKEETASKAAAAAEARIPLAKAFGFKDIPVAAQVHVNRLMAKAEATTGLVGGEALAKFAESL